MNQVTLYEFNQLSDKGKANAVWNGALVGDREDRHYKILLYAVGDFYVEVFYNAPGNVIEKFRSFLSMGPLEPYLEKIKLPF